MSSLKTSDYTGYSHASIDEAVSDALEKAGHHQHVEVIETRSSKLSQDERHYQVTIKAREINTP